MANKFSINFKASKNQNISNGDIVTYVNEQTLSTIREYLTLKTDFFVVSNIENLQKISISNGIDTITSTEDQLIRVIPFIDEIPEMTKPMPDGDPNKYLRELIRWNDQEELLRSYPLRDNYLSIISSGLIITEKDFYLETSNELTRDGKRKVFASLIPDKISLYL